MPRRFTAPLSFRPPDLETSLCLPYQWVITASPMLESVNWPSLATDRSSFSSYRPRPLTSSISGASAEHPRADLFKAVSRLMSVVPERRAAVVRGAVGPECIPQPQGSGREFFRSLNARIDRRDDAEKSADPVSCNRE